MLDPISKLRLPNPNLNPQPQPHLGFAWRRFCQANCLIRTLHSDPTPSPPTQPSILNLNSILGLFWGHLSGQIILVSCRIKQKFDPPPTPSPQSRPQSSTTTPSRVCFGLAFTGKSSLSHVRSKQTFNAHPTPFLPPGPQSSTRAPSRVCFGTRGFSRTNRVCLMSGQTNVPRSPNPVSPNPTRNQLQPELHLGSVSVQLFGTNGLGLMSDQTFKWLGL